MRKVLLYSVLLVLGLAGSQALPGALGAAWHGASETVRLLTMWALGFIMIHVGYEFEIDRQRPRAYAVDYGVAMTAAAFPWIFAALWFLLLMMPPGSIADFQAWKEALLVGRFAAPTSAGILFSMLAAAGLSATWVFRKARVLAIFDDLDTVLLMIPLKAMMVGLRWQLAVIVVIMAVMLWVAWRWLHRVRIPVSWPWVLGYAAGIVAVSEAIYRFSKLIDDVVPIHIEVLLPAFVLGCVLARPAGCDPHGDDAHEGHQEGPESPGEQRVATLVSAAFMVLVGLSMPSLLGAGADAGSTGAAAAANPGAADAAAAGGGPALGWLALALHVIGLTVVINLGKMFSFFCYRREATWRERLAVSIGMWPRGEVGAGVLVLSLSYGVGGAAVTVAIASLALNLLLTGVFIVAVKRLIQGSAAPDAAAGA